MDGASSPIPVLHNPLSTQKPLLQAAFFVMKTPGACPGFGGILLK